MTPLLLSNVSQPKILQSTALSFHETVIKMGMMSRCYVLDNVANINVSNSVYDRICPAVLREPCKQILQIGLLYWIGKNKGPNRA